jgi:hypothetical protein
MLGMIKIFVDNLGGLRFAASKKCLSEKNGGLPGIAIGINLISIRRDDAYCPLHAAILPLAAKTF